MKNYKYKIYAKSLWIKMKYSSRFNILRKMAGLPLLKLIKIPVRMTTKKGYYYLLPLLFLSYTGFQLIFGVPDYNGKYITDLNDDDKVCRLLLNDIKEFKEKHSGLGGVAIDHNLKIVLYKVKDGDSIWEIHKKTGLSMDTLISINHQKNVHLLQPGQVIFIPNKNGISYKIGGGETLESIAEEFNVKAEDIIEVNDLTDDSIEAGKDVFIPNVRFSLEKRINILGRFLKPLLGRVTSSYGPRRNPFNGSKSYHYGIDLANVYGARIRAAESGRVIFAGTRGGYGKLVIIKHSGMYSTRYGHLSRYAVRHGQQVRQGQVIGYVGSTGNVTGPHLHFEIRKFGRAINPYFIMRNAK